MAVPDEVRDRTQRLLERLLKAGGVPPEDAASAAEFAVGQDPQKAPPG